MLIITGFGLRNEIHNFAILWISAMKTQFSRQQNSYWLYLQIYIQRSKKNKPYLKLRIEMSFCRLMAEKDTSYWGLAALQNQLGALMWLGLIGGVWS